MAKHKVRRVSIVFLSHMPYQMTIFAGIIRYAKDVGNWHLCWILLEVLVPKFVLGVEGRRCHRPILTEMGSRGC